MVKIQHDQEKHEDELRLQRARLTAEHNKKIATMQHEAEMERLMAEHAARGKMY